MNPEEEKLVIIELENKQKYSLKQPDGISLGVNPETVAIMTLIYHVIELQDRVDKLEEKIDNEIKTINNNFKEVSESLGRADSDIGEIINWINGKITNS